ncbi:Uncharacterised protein [Mycobacteroides abscessus subsp. abscessus]|uniref:hypothetical protein n=1 Tax=Mycobacteroides abscessus TaxID=36809 RepID=UPI0009A85878|nr:hypothetical protein [Mycobacteroides abscessus]SLJ23909.1 Uncharacterised protein [Mycobacteroides abscessus subsp. abscessus]
MKQTVRPIESMRPSPTLIRVWFSDDSTAEIPCPAAVIGNPIEREIAALELVPWQLRDAGELEPALAAIIDRIPATWQARLDVEPGWYQLVIATHRQLLAVAPDYQPLVIRQRWCELRLRPWHEDEAVRRELVTVAVAARERSRGICEWCSGPTDPAETQNGAGWLLRLCPPCGQLREDWNSAWLEAAWAAEEEGKR